MYLVQVLPLAALLLIVVGCGVIMRLLMPEMRQDWLLIIAIPICISVCWPVFRKFGIPPIWVRCPSCGRKPKHFELGVHDRGLLMKCPLCEGSFIMRGVWRKRGTHRLFLPNGSADIDIIDGNLDTVRTVRVRWPKWIAARFAELPESSREPQVDEDKEGRNGARVL